jgi:hypothetical protein
MDQGPLVEPQIDDGFRVVKRLVGGGFPVAAAFWVRSGEERRWKLYVASKLFDESGPSAAAGKVVEAVLQLEDPWITISDITVVGERNPITQDVLRVLNRRPGPMAIRLRQPVLGNLETEEAYIYPRMEEAARRPPPKVKIIGIKQDPSETPPQEVREEVGCLEGFIGEPEFNTKLAALIRSKFGSPEQFAVAYPRVVLESVEA